MFLANEGDPNKLFRNDGADGFSDATTGPIGIDRQYIGVCWGDYDLDGDVDLYLTSLSTAGSRLFRNNGSGAFADVTIGPLGAPRSSGAAWGDYDNDGDLDIYVSSYDGSRLLNNAGPSHFILISGLPSVPRSDGVAWADYDNDGDLDLYLSTEFSNGRLFRNDGNEVFSDVTSGPLGGPASYAVAWGDYDNDADLDLYVTASRLMRNDGNGAFVDATEGPLSGASFGVGAAWADYDGDGDLDLFMASNSSFNLSSETTSTTRITGSSCSCWEQSPTERASERGCARSPALQARSARFPEGRGSPHRML